MTGPEHYTEAEKLITVAREQSNPNDLGIYTYDDTLPDVGKLLADAQVHATLAAAAASALGASHAESRAWADAAGTRLSGPA
jgi:hypothetical protein